VELASQRLAYYDGERRNIKITTPEDLLIAEALLGTKER
jgi:2-C-methyl-D-erythritol 4-phosphate cytidylyltransferase